MLRGAIRPAHLSCRHPTRKRWLDDGAVRRTVRP
jgi:hypothetical protein